ncbi:site-2 protease family protein [Pyramidobacter sp. SM-530-WT-4B]|uniref:Site-2 protease family protein n=1 Tax=Pyramidobacter porci TaxID=2605789 RepID=A0A6L5Y9F5_9BACT|nr:site-2 protease family protein [Pyramidobacter porci]MCI6259555.1 site-2 protease family protein [Pyramidobacter sp.]MDY2649254.1 site-2 protease family protein [Pyramidobacter porci]MST54735.1 site-2 protease family protein [Pyramidobacter porci]
MNRFFAEAGREFISLLPAVPAILWAISFHEFCHGWAALRCGDPTAKDAGRLTLNPMAHFDLWGALCMFLFHFGWARPVPIDPYNFRRPRRDLFLVSVAGVAGNTLTAVAAGLAIRGLVRFFPAVLFGNYGLQQVLIAFVTINLNFAVFNLIPVPPLDGSKLLALVLPRTARPAFEWLDRYSLPVLLALIYLGVVGRLMSPAVRWGLRLILG